MPQKYPHDTPKTPHNPPQTNPPILTNFSKTNPNTPLINNPSHIILTNTTTQPHNTIVY